MKKVVLAVVAAATFMACNQANSTQVEDVEQAAEATEQSVNYITEPGSSSIIWHGEKITGDAHEGTVNISEGTISVQDGQITAGNFELDMNSIATTDEMDAEYVAKLEGHLKGADFFDAATYPTARLEVVESTADSIKANLTIKGITHAITIPYELSKAGKTIEVHSVFNIDRSKWDVRYGSGSFFEGLGDNLIQDEIGFNVTYVGIQE